MAAVLTLRKCVNGTRRMIHLAQNSFSELGYLPSPLRKCAAQREEQAFLKAQHTANEI